MHAAGFLLSMGELAFVAVFAGAVLLEGAAEFGFVALGGGLLGLERRVARVGGFVLELLGEEDV